MHLAYTMYGYTKQNKEKRKREKEAIDSRALPHSLVLPAPLIFFPPNSSQAGRSSSLAHSAATRSYTARVIANCRDRPCTLPGAYVCQPRPPQCQPEVRRFNGLSLYIHDSPHPVYATGEAQDELIVQRIPRPGLWLALAYLNVHHCRLAAAVIAGAGASGSGLFRPSEGGLSTTNSSGARVAS